MPEDETEGHRVVVRLDRVLAERGMTVAELSRRTGITVVNLSILKNGRAKAIRFSTLTAVCDALGCQPGDLLTVAGVIDPQAHSA
jgi:putative transcriptional regulator